MICQPCAEAAASHTFPHPCAWPVSCPCKHKGLEEYLQERIDSLVNKLNDQVPPELMALYREKFPETQTLLADDVPVKHIGFLRDGTPVIEDSTLPDRTMVWESLPMHFKEFEKGYQEGLHSSVPFPLAADGRRAMGKSVSERARSKLWQYAPRRRAMSKKWNKPS